MFKTAGGNHVCSKRQGKGLLPYFPDKVLAAIKRCTFKTGRYILVSKANTTQGKTQHTMMT